MNFREISKLAKYKHPPGLACDVQKQLASQYMYDQKFINIPELAAIFGMFPRSFQRKLQEEGVNLKQQKTQIRSAYIVKILSVSVYEDIDGLAKQCGMSDRTSLSTFTMRHFGLTTKQLHAIVFGKKIKFPFEIYDFKHIKQNLQTAQRHIDVVNTESEYAPIPKKTVKKYSRH